MKYLFVIQGEGRGHLTQAISMYDMLIKNGDEVVEVLVGKSKSRKLPQFFVERIHCPILQFDSPNFLPSPKNKKSLVVESIFYNLFKMPTYIRSMYFINKRIKETKADKVINFYEMLVGLTYAFYRPSVPYICIGHQYLFLHPDFVFPKKNKLELWSLIFFTHITCFRASKLLALSFHEMLSDERIVVVPPLIRAEVLNKTISDGDYILGYMLNAGFSEEIIRWHKQNKEIPLHFFWDKKDFSEELTIDENLVFHQLNDVTFLNYMTGCKAYASTGGFESICEAMYLQKPVMMVPVHIEQECNAYDAMNAGAGVVSSTFNLTILIDFISSYYPNKDFICWVENAEKQFLAHI
jgi:uncharacterized protein (TIGR00661 family)